MSTPPDPEAPELPLILFVNGLIKRDDRGTLALLRGALSDSDERQMRAWRVLARFGGIPGGDGQNFAEAVRTVAGLMALPGLRHSAGAGSFGQACFRLVSDDERSSFHQPDQTGPVARRVEHLLAATHGEICGRVRSLARRLERAATTTAYLDFHRLYNDLRFWSDRTKARWAADFWGVTNEDLLEAAAEAVAVESPREEVAP